MPFTLALVMAVLGSIALIEIIYRVNGSSIYERPLASLVIALCFCICIGALEWGLQTWLTEAPLRSYRQVMLAMSVVLSLVFSGVLGYANTQRWCYIDDAVHGMALLAPTLLLVLVWSSI